MASFKVDFLVDFFSPWFCCGVGSVGFFRFFEVFSLVGGISWDEVGWFVFLPLL